MPIIAPSSDSCLWDGRTDGGRLLPQGASICHIEVVANVGDEVAIARSDL
ncbi:MAG: hypothetical protein VX733_12970 [Candidatus Latescibacterota bacterium]|nr:hypothetical protein [Candidatus Latescibacterota bacterium]